MTEQTNPATEIMLQDALDHLRSAIALLDRAGAPGHIAAHADLAASELERACDIAPRLGSPDELEMARLAE